MKLRRILSISKKQLRRSSELWNRAHIDRRQFNCHMNKFVACDLWIEMRCCWFKIELATWIYTWNFENELSLDIIIKNMSHPTTQNLQVDRSTSFHWFNYQFQAAATCCRSLQNNNMIFTTEFPHFICPGFQFFKLFLI